MSKIRKKIFSKTLSVAKKSARIILCTLLVGLVFTTGCEKLKNLREGIEEIRPFNPSFTEDAVMDTLKGEWTWFKMTGGLAGGTAPNNFKSVIRILNQNEDESVNYQVFVADTLFYKGSFQIQDELWSYRKFNIKLPHGIMLPPGYEQDNWLFHFFNEEEIYFWDGMMDGYFYHYKKTEEE